MINIGILLAVAGTLSAFASSTSLSIRYHYQLSNDLLTTEKVWQIDPEQVNPHLQRWVIQRHTEIQGLVSVPEKNGKFGVEASGVLTSAQGYVRGPGPWFRGLDEFSCSLQPDSWFSTQQGAEKAAAVAGEIWEKVLHEHKVKLSVQLSKVNAETSDLALERGNETFKAWVENLGDDWRREVLKKVRSEEWKFYLADAKEGDFCPRKGSSKVSPPSLISMMEPPASKAPLPTHLLARAPVRLWNGLFTIRVNVEVGDKILNGRFLIDSTANKSVISPVFLSGQGIDPAWVSIPGSAPEKIRWNGLWDSERGLAPRAYIDRINVSGLEIPLNEFLVHETDFFDPPDYVGSCCDGVLGADFLRIYPVEFKSTAPAELRIWPREEFHLGDDSPWAEISIGPAGDLISSCSVVPDSNEKSGHSVQSLHGIRWDTGEDEFLNIHLPWQKYAKSIRSNAWDIVCQNFNVSQGVQATFPKPPWSSKDTGLFSTERPAASVGMLSLLGVNKTFTFDLPHGRIWFTGGVRTEKGHLHDQSGLTLIYKYVNGERELHVAKIKSRSLATNLVQAGLKEGMQVTQVDSKPAEEMDLWEVERRLAGDYGKIVTIQWKTKNGLKMAPLELTKQLY